MSNSESGHSLLVDNSDTCKNEWRVPVIVADVTEVKLGTKAERKF